MAVCVVHSLDLEFVVDLLSLSALPPFLTQPQASSAVPEQHQVAASPVADEPKQLVKTPSQARVCLEGSLRSLQSTSPQGPSSFLGKVPAEYREGDQSRPYLRNPQAEYDAGSDLELRDLADNLSTGRRDRAELDNDLKGQHSVLRGNVRGQGTVRPKRKEDLGDRGREGARQEDPLPVTMNIDVVGRMRPMTRVEGATNLLVEANGRVAAHAGGPYFGFQTLHSSNTSTYDVFKTSVETLLDLYLAGYNVCLLIGGESGAGKSYNMVGETNNRPGLVQMVLDHLFAKLSEERYHPQTRMSKQDPEVTMEMVEVYNELVKDLMSAPHALNMGLLDITESAVKGVHAKNATTMRVSDASMGGTYFRNAWGRRTEATTDHGPFEESLFLEEN